MFKGNKKMLPRKLLIVIIFLAIKLVLSQTIQGATPTCTYSANTFPSAQCYPVNASPATITALPASTVTSAAVPLTASPVPITATAVPITATSLPSNIPKATIAASSVPIATVTATTPKTFVSSMPTATLSESSMPCSTVIASPKHASSSTPEVKAYFLPAPIPDPKVTILAGDMPSVVEVKPRIADPGILEVKPSKFADAGFIEVSPMVCADPSYIEVTGTFSPDAMKTGNVRVSQTELPAPVNSPTTPFKRISIACANDDLRQSFNKSPLLSNQQTVRPGISKIDFIPTTSTQNKNDNPIDFDGLLDGFINCL